MASHTLCRDQFPSEEAVTWVQARDSGGGARGGVLGGGTGEVAVSLRLG